MCNVNLCLLFSLFAEGGIAKLRRGKCWCWLLFAIAADAEDRCRMQISVCWLSQKRGLVEAGLFASGSASARPSGSRNSAAVIIVVWWLIVHPSIGVLIEHSVFSVFDKQTNNYNQAERSLVWADLARSDHRTLCIILLSKEQARAEQRTLK